MIRARFGGGAAVALALAAAAVAAGDAAAQAEVAAWGNLEGIRVDGHLMAFETGVCLLRPDGTEVTRTSKERQRPRFSREGAVRRVTSALGGISLREVVEDPSPGLARVDLTVAADTQGVTAETVFCLDLPLDDFAAGSAHPTGGAGGGTATVALGPIAAGSAAPVRRRASG
ncbi:MAG TPA: hypothetical protein VFZ18_05230, partial [Longimicrobiaceae bacterium]